MKKSGQEFLDKSKQISIGQRYPSCGAISSVCLFLQTKLINHAVVNIKNATLKMEKIVSGVMPIGVRASLAFFPIFKLSSNLFLTKCQR